MKCEICGEEFEPKNCMQKYCSKPCQQKAANNNRKIRQATVHIVKCQMCGKEFEKLNGNQRYCCAECKAIAKNRCDAARNKTRNRCKEMFQLQQITEADTDPYVKLASAIVFKTAQDYYKALTRKNKDMWTKPRILMIKDDIKTDYFNSLTNLNVELLFQKVEGM